MLTGWGTGLTSSERLIDLSGAQYVVAVQELKTARKTAAKAQRQQLKQTRADRERKIMLAGEALLRHVDRGEWDEVDFRAMMDDYLSRPADRSLFELDDE